jgi:hypothetical protein
MLDFGFVVGLEGFVGGSDQIRFRLNAVSVVVNNPTAALAKLVVNGPFDLSEFLGGQFRQYGLDFGNRTHADKIIANESGVNGGHLTLIRGLKSLCSCVANLPGADLSRSFPSCPDRRDALSYVY